MHMHPDRPTRHITRTLTLVDKGVRVLLQAQALLEDAEAAHDPEEVVVAPEEDVQAHLDVVPVLVHPRADLPPREAPRLVDFHLRVCASWGCGGCKCGVYSSLPLSLSIYIYICLSPLALSLYIVIYGHTDRPTEPPYIPCAPPPPGPWP